MEQKHWLKSYPEADGHDVDVGQYASLTALLGESFRKGAERPSSVRTERWMSYRELNRRSTALGAWPQPRGLASGARVAIMLPNILQFTVAVAAVGGAGYTCVYVNPLYTPCELEHQLKDSGASASPIVILQNFFGTLEEVVEQTVARQMVVASMGELLGSWHGRWITFAVRQLARLVPAFQLPLTQRRSVTSSRAAVVEGSAVALCPMVLDLDSVAFLQYAGETGGLSEGAILSHRNILQSEAWFTPTLNRVADVSSTNVIAAVPLYHSFALTLCLGPMRRGSHLTLIPNPTDIEKFVAVLKRRPFHVLCGGQHLVQRIAAGSAVQNHRFFPAPCLPGRHDGGTARNCTSMASGVRMPAGARLGHVRNLRDRHQQPADRVRALGDHRAAAARGSAWRSRTTRATRLPWSRPAGSHPPPGHDAGVRPAAAGERENIHDDGFMRTGDVAPWTSEATRASSSEKRT
jgi:acyl-CoA synthetase (AMP-forming)/AMP-acid ligase II